MAAATVSIVMRVRRPDGSRAHYATVTGSNGRLKAHFGLVNGVLQNLPNGIYYLRFRVNGKRVWECVGPDASKAVTAKLQREHQLQSAKLGLEAPTAGGTLLPP